MHHLLLAGVALLWVVLPSAVQPLDLPPGASKTECRPRVFWIWISKSFLGQNTWQLQAQNGGGDDDDAGSWYTITETIASQTGIAITGDLDGNVVIRVSFLGRPVQTADEVNFSLVLQLLVSPSVSPTAYVVAMSCPLNTTWSPREIVCEENYIEVSVRRIVPSDGMQPVASPVPTAKEWYITFQFPNSTSRTMAASEARKWGYGVRTTGTRVVLWAPHHTAMSFLLPLDGLHLEVTMSTMTYRQSWVTLLVDTTTACPADPPYFTTTELTWATPAFLSPLVANNTYSNGTSAMGVDGMLVGVNKMQECGYHLISDASSLRITIPIGAPGGQIQSDVQNNTYGTTYSINLLLERTWMGVNQDVTKYTAYKPITTPFLPQPLVFVDYTIPAMKHFNISLGNFFPDVALPSLTVGGQLLTLGETAARRFMVTKVANNQGSGALFLTVPFSDLLVEKQVLPGWITRYILYITYTLTLVTQGKNFTYTNVVQTDLQDIVPPAYSGTCGKKTLIMDVTHGSMDKYWVPYIRDLPLTADLITAQKYTMYSTATTFHLEVPVPAAGLVYEVINLRWIRARLDFFLKDLQTLEIMSSFSVTCNFTTGRLLVCFPNGTMVATVLSSDTIPGLDARRTHLRDRSCLPTEANRTMALFVFSATSCGSTSRMDGNSMMCENAIIFDKEVIPPGRPAISRDPEYKLTLRCHFPTRQTLRVSGKMLPAALLQRGIRVGRKIARDVPQMVDRDLAVRHTDQVTDFVSVGPVEKPGAEDVVSSKYSGEEQWHTWPWLLSVGLAALCVLAAASVCLAIRVLKC